MKPFTFVHGRGSWPAGDTVLHVYVVPDLDRDRALAALIDGAGRALSGWPVALVEPRWLHITLDQITGRPASAIGHAERATLVERLTTALADVRPFEVQVGSLLSYHSGVIADLDPDEPLDHLHQQVRSAIGSACGHDATRYEWGVQHLTVAYATGQADSDAAQRALRRVRPSHAALHIGRVQLVDVAADPDNRTITWDALAAIPLGGMSHADQVSQVRKDRHGT